MQFFRFFQFTTYDIANTATTTVLTDITQHARIAERLRQYESSFYEYVIQEGERPDTIAEKLYGSVDYTWVILIVNNILSLYDWPLTYSEFNAYLTSKYGSIQAAEAGIKTYYTIDGIQVDAITYNILPPNRRGDIRTPYDEEVALNDAKRRIKVVRQGFISGLANSIRTLFQ